MAIFEVGSRYTRAEVQEMLSVPQDRRGGNWDTGYTEYDGEFYVFCNIGIAGRTGHDYENYWEGDTLIWRAKNNTNTRQPLIRRLTSGELPVNMFSREQDRASFTYIGKVLAREVEETTPVKVRWSLTGAGTGKVGRTMIERVLSDAGFTISKGGVKTRSATFNSLVLYVKQETEAFPLVISPSWEDRITDLTMSGAERPKDRFFYHNSTMRAFPQRQHKGKGLIPFGIDFAFPDRASLERFIGELKASETNPTTSRAAGDEMDVDPQTETEAVRAARLGQQRFRQHLLERYAGTCALTGIDMPELLRASHIVPWCDATPKERLDPNNGLLLAVHIDSLFDRGLISFADNGALLVSPRVSDSVRSRLGLIEAMTLADYEHSREYLKRHRERHFGQVER